MAMLKRQIVSFGGTAKVLISDRHEVGAGHDAILDAWLFHRNDEVVAFVTKLRKPKSGTGYRFARVFSSTDSGRTWK